MIEKPRCRRPRCFARRRNLDLALPGASIAMIVGYFTFSEPESDTSELAVPGSVTGPDRLSLCLNGRKQPFLCRKASVSRSSRRRTKLETNLGRIREKAEVER